LGLAAEKAQAVQLMVETEVILSSAVSLPVLAAVVADITVITVRVADQEVALGM
jgi:hypothetical protein